MVGLISPNLSRTWTAEQLDEGDGASPGALVSIEGKKYKFLCYRSGTGAIPAVAGQAAYYFSASGVADNQMTSDLSDTSEVGAGILQSAPADGEYAWVQTSGLAIVPAATLAGVNNGDPVTPTGAADGTLATAAAITNHVCGIVGNAGQGQLMCDFPD